jgi:hypothetical protein
MALTNPIERFPMAVAGVPRGLDGSSWTPCPPHVNGGFFGGMPCKVNAIRDADQPAEIRIRAYFSLIRVSRNFDLSDRSPSAIQSPQEIDWGFVGRYHSH